MSPKNAFVEAFKAIGIDFDRFALLVVDMLHELELGVWKDFFTHLLRILFSLGSEVIAELNRRCVWLLGFISGINIYTAFVKFPLLAAEPFDGSLQTSLHKRNLPLGIMKIFFKYVDFLHSGNREANQHYSVLCHVSKVSSILPMTLSFKTLSSIWPYFMDMQNFACIRMIHWNYSLA
jgi:hypothetical protein